MNRISKMLRFQLERWIQRGVPYQLIFVAALIITISVVGGLAAWVATSQFNTPFDGFWWSFLRLTDPGYLGDDQGAVLRVVSSIVTVLGYVLFMGSLIAIMTGWLNQTLRRLENGLSRISMQGHVVILGWTNRTREIVSQLLGAEGRLRRFLAEHDQRILRIVIVADEMDAEKRRRLRTSLGDRWRERQIFLRAGSCLKLMDLQRFDLSRAAAIIVPGDEFAYGNAEMSDTRVVKTLLNLRQILEPAAKADRPRVVAEMFDPRKIPVARNAIKEKLAVVPSDGIIARLLTQMIRDQRLAPVFLELLSHRRGVAPYVRGFPELAGNHPVDLDGRFEKAIVIGAVRKEGGRTVTHLNPPRDFRLQRDDMLVFLARTYDDCEITGQSMEDERFEPITQLRAPEPSTRRVLILGWSQEVGFILQELGNSDATNAEVMIVSRVPQEKRDETLKEFNWNPERLRVEHLERDYTVSSVFETIDLQGFTNILFLASTSMKNREEADARTILGYGLLKSVLEDQGRNEGKGLNIVVECVDPYSQALFSEPRDVMLITPKILGHLQTHVALRLELSSVFKELFVPGGVEVGIRTAEAYGLSDSAIRYRDVELQAMARSEVAIGVLKASGTSDEKLELCPDPNRRWTPAEDEVFIVLAAGDQN